MTARCDMGSIQRLKGPMHEKFLAEFFYANQACTGW
jgi:hypothetical protein